MRKLDCSTSKYFHRNIELFEQQFVAKNASYDMSENRFSELGSLIFVKSRLV